MTVSSTPAATRARQRLAVTFVIFAITLGVTIRLALSWLSLTHLPVVSDEAEIGLQAIRIADGATPLFVYGLSYLFPLDAYLLAPFIDHLPRNAGSVRLPYLAAGYLSVVGFLLLARAAFPAGSRWPAVVLVALPSAYWMLIQAAYVPPQYAYTTLVVLAVLGIAVRATRGGAAGAVATWLAGLLTGIALSLQPVFVTVLLATGMVIALRGTPRASALRVVRFGVGMIAGLTPLLLGKLLHPDAFATVTALRDPGAAIAALQNHVLTVTLPRALGADPTLFPDFPHYLGLPAALRSVFAVLFGVVFMAAAALRLGALVRAARRRRLPGWSPVDIFLIATIAAVAAFPFSNRSGEFQFRYLLPAVWSVPFVVGYLYQQAGHGGRILVAVAAAALAMVDGAVAMGVAERWSRPGYIAERADTWPIEDLVELLDRLGIDRCHADLWLAHRIPYHTDERIFCTQPYNSRHPHWPLPDKEQVDASDRVAYVMTDTISARLGARGLRIDMYHNDVGYEHIELPPFHIFHDFRHPPTDGTCLLEGSAYRVRSDPQGTPLPVLHDGERTGRWWNAGNQRRDMGVVLEFDVPHRVGHLVLYYDPREAGFAPELHVEGRSNGRWLPLEALVPPRPNRFIMLNRHPVYGNAARQVLLGRQPAEALRIRIARAEQDRPWKLGEIAVGVVCADGAPAAP